MHQCASWLKMKVCKLYIASTYSFSKRKAMCCTVLITSWRSLGYKLFYAYLCTCSHKTLLRACYFRGKEEVINYKSWSCVQSFASLICNPHQLFIPVVCRQQICKALRKNLATKDGKACNHLMINYCRFTKQRINELSIPKQSKATWWTSFGWGFNTQCDNKPQV